MSSSGIDKKEYSAYIPATYSESSNAAGTAAAIDTSIGSAAALPLKLLAESIKQNAALDLKLQSAQPAQLAVANTSAAKPLAQIPQHEAIDKAMQALKVLFNDNLLGAANPISLDQLHGLHLEQIIDISWITLVLAIYQQTSSDKRNQKALFATISESNSQNLDEVRSGRMKKVLIFYKSSAISASQRTTFECIIEAVNILNKFPQFYRIPYRVLQEPLVAQESILIYAQEILDRMTQHMIPKMELLLPTLKQKTQNILEAETKAEAIKGNKHLNIKQVVLRDALGQVNGQRDSAVRFNKPLIYLLTTSLKFLKGEGKNSKQLDQCFLMENALQFHWKMVCKSVKPNLFLLMESLKYEDHIDTYTTGRFLTKSSELFCRRVLTQSINNQIVFYQSLISKLLKFKASSTPEFKAFNATVQTERAGWICTLCVHTVCLKDPGKGSDAQERILNSQKQLQTIRSMFHEKLVNLADELKMIMGQCVDEFIKTTTLLFDKKNLFRISSNQDELIPDDRFLYDLEKFIELNHLYLRNEFREIAVTAIAMGKNKNVIFNTSVVDFIMDQIGKNIQKLESMKAAENFDTTFAEHLKSFSCHIVSSDNSSSKSLRNTPLIERVNDVLIILKPISEVIIPIMDVSRKAITLSREGQTQSVDYWLESISDSRFNEIDPLEAVEKTENYSKEIASKKKSKFKGKKKTAASGSSESAANPSLVLEVTVPFQRTLNYASKAASQFATMRWQLSGHHHLPNHVVVPNSLVGKHREMAQIAIHQQVYPAECVQATLSILESSKNIQDQRLAVLSFFLYGHIFLEQSLTGPYLKLSANKKLTHRLSILLADLGLKGCDKWIEVNPWDTRSFRYPHACLQNNKGKVPLALWHATQPNDSSVKETKGILDQLVLEAVALQQGLQKQSASSSSNETAVVKIDGAKVTEEEVKEASAADQSKMNQLALTIAKYLLPLKEAVKKLSESTYKQQIIKNALKDVEYHLQNLHDLLGLVMRHGEQQFLFLYANIAMLSTQYLAENLGVFLSLLSGSEMRDHNLMAYQYCVDLGGNLKESDFATFQDINLRKGSEYLFQYFNNRDLSKISPRMHYLSGLYATASLALKEREGEVVEQLSRVSLADLHGEFYKFLEPLVALATSLVNNHVLNDSVK